MSASQNVPERTIMHNEIVAFGSGGSGRAGQARVRRQAGGGTSAAVGRAIQGGVRANLSVNQARRINNLARTGRATFGRNTNRRITRRLRNPATR